jgi:hypothetical protein
VVEKAILDKRNLSSGSSGIGGSNSPGPQRKKSTDHASFLLRVRVLCG